MARKTPSYKGLKPASEVASRIKRNNRRTDTKPEVMLRSELWRIGLRYRKNVARLPGKPDVVFSKARVVVFCDGDFWHGRNWELRKQKLQTGTNAAYWTAKIEANMARDLRNTALLEQLGWLVIRAWEGDIKRSLSEIANSVKEIVESRSSLNLVEKRESI